MYVRGGAGGVRSQSAAAHAGRARQPYSLHAATRWARSVRREQKPSWAYHRSCARDHTPGRSHAMHDAGWSVQRQASLSESQVRIYHVALSVPEQREVNQQIRRAVARYSAAMDLAGRTDVIEGISCLAWVADQSARCPVRS